MMACNSTPVSVAFCAASFVGSVFPVNFVLFLDYHAGSCGDVRVQKS
ncbi:MULTISPECIES: hypothetical protein [Candidatus Ichthyocystis]|nr:MULTISPECIES: hypothetical protein [Ichthyocystis]